MFFIFLQLFKTVCDYLIALLFLITVTNANNDKLATITNGAIIVESPVLTLVLGLFSGFTSGFTSGVGASILTNLSIASVN